MVLLRFCKLCDIFVNDLRPAPLPDQHPFYPLQQQRTVQVPCVQRPGALVPEGILPDGMLGAGGLGFAAVGGAVIVHRPLGPPPGHGAAAVGAAEQTGEQMRLRLSGSPADSPLLTAKNCVITPHISWASLEARQRLMDIAVENLRAFLAGKTVNAVNL